MPEELRQQILSLCDKAVEAEWGADAAMNIGNIVEEIRTIVEEA